MSNAIVVFIFMVSPWPAAAETTLNLDDPYEYRIVDLPVRDALRDFGVNLGIPVNIAPGIEGRVRGSLPDGTARQFIDRLGQNYGFTDYFDGRVLHFTPSNETETRLLALRSVSLAELREALSSLGLTDPRYNIRPSSIDGVALVAGPPRFIALTESTLSALSQSRSAPADGAAAPSRPPQSNPVTSNVGAPLARRPLVIFRGESISVQESGWPQ